MSEHMVRTMRAVRLPTAMLLSVFTPAAGVAQSPAVSAAGVPVAALAPAPVASRPESVVVVPGAKFESGGVYSFFFGKNYRAMWLTPLKVEVLDLRSFGGGLHPTKKGGGLQSLRFENEEGDEYVFRLIAKFSHLPPGMAGAMATSIFDDQVSAEHPVAALVTAPLLEAAGVLHATPTLVIMPHDTLLGAFGEMFAGRLGMIERYPGKPGKSGKHAGFAGALEIVDSDSLRTLLNRDPRERLDARALLTARLMDLFLNDIDRHPGQWKWARMQKGQASEWLPIPRDRDQAFVAFRGVLLSVARLGAPNLVPFDGTISIAGLTYNSLEMDRRLLGGLERPVWDSVAIELGQRLTDAVIDGALERLPAEYLATAPAMAATLRLRRAHLPRAASAFYALLAKVVDVHGTDAADRLSVTRTPGGFVEVQLQSQGEPPFFRRRFEAKETSEIRVYLHGGNDSAVVTGDARGSIPVKIIGGNGVNWLGDSSRVDGQLSGIRLIDAGMVNDVIYGEDTLMNRLPFEVWHGKMLPPGRDRGSFVEPSAGTSLRRELGLTLDAGIRRYTYGFRDQPYSSLVNLDVEYAVKLPGFRVAVDADKRWEGTPLHLTVAAFVSQFEVVGFHGLGNATPDSASGFFEVRQRQWRVRPALARSLGTSTDLTLGPVFQYTVTDSVPSRLVSATRPYGFGTFGQLGMELGFRHEIRDRPHQPQRRFVLEVEGGYYPAILDVASPFEELTVRAGASIQLNVVTQPTLMFRAGAKKVFGAFPFFESAFIGGNHSLRRMLPQRYAGDAAAFISSELHVPLTSFGLFVPLQAGVLATVESGRVWVGSTSPGGWHNVLGYGIWIGRASGAFSFSCTMTTEPGRAGPHCQTGLGF